MLPSRFTFAPDCMILFNVEKFNMIIYIVISKQRVCLITDTWTSIQNLSGLSLTTHYIENDRKLQHNVLNCCPISSHVGDVISATHEKHFLGWDINKVLTVTTDNASSNVFSLRIYCCSRFYQFV